MMAWDEAPPTTEELAPVTSGWDAAPPTEEELKAPVSFGGFAKNLGSDVAGNAKDVVNLGKGLLTHPIKTAEAIPGALLEEGKRIGGGELLSGHPLDALKKLGTAAYEKPLTTGLDAATLFGLGEGAAGGGAKAGELGAEAAPAAEEATEAAAKAAPVAEAIPKAAEAAPAESVMGKAASAATSIPLPNEAQQALEKAKEVKDYISRGYEGFAKKPGAINDVADWMQNKSQMMAAQQMGATPLQARQIGHEGMRAIGQYAIDNGIVGPTVGLKGMRAAQERLLEAAGDKLGALRKAADSVRNPPTDSVDVLQAVRQKLDPIFARGSRSGEAGAYAKALEDVEDSKPTFEEIAETATKLNKAANEANRLNQPHGAFTDVANEISRINNERIKTLLGSQKAAEYEQALREYGVNKKIGEMLKRKEAGEVKRLGPGSLTSNLTQKAMDEIGYRTGAKVANKVSTSILKNPAVAKSLPSLFKEFTHQVEDVAHEVTGMAYGGIVPEDIAQFAGKH